MENSTCSIEYCKQPIYINRYKLCAYHYGVASRAQAIPRAQGRMDPAGRRHSLSAVNRLERTGMCSICGSTGVKFTKQGSAACYGVVRMQKAEYRRVKREKEIALGIAKPFRRSNPASRRRYANRYLSKVKREEYIRNAGAACEICSSAKMLVVDHCHKSGKIRGVLCNRCNVALGWMDDSIARLNGAVAYLEDRSN